MSCGLCSKAGDRFECWFQPIVNTSSQEIFAHECRVRLNSGAPRAGAEIQKFDSCARRVAIRSAAGQSRQNKYFVNFLPASVGDPEQFMTHAMAALAESAMRPENIVFEALDSENVSDGSHLCRIRDYCWRYGFEFALDNVGTGAGGAGVGSLDMVRDLHPDYIGIDRSLIANVERPMVASTLQRLVEAAGRLGVIVIADGVEKPEMMENLWLLGVRFMQGRLFGRPAPRIVRQNVPGAAREPSDWQMFDPDLLKLSQALVRAGGSVSHLV